MQPFLTFLVMQPLLCFPFSYETFLYSAGLPATFSLVPSYFRDIHTTFLLSCYCSFSLIFVQAFLSPMAFLHHYSSPCILTRPLVTCIHAEIALDPIFYRPPECMQLFILTRFIHATISKRPCIHATTCIPLGL
jgi:hypothetical protein